jgi:hypothetical protein
MRRCCGYLGSAVLERTARPMNGTEVVARASHDAHGGSESHDELRDDHAVSIEI